MSRVGYAVAFVMIIVVAAFEEIILAFPAWIAMVSLFIMRRERRRAQAARVGLAPSAADD
jgi:hypothetical protein